MSRWKAFAIHLSVSILVFLILLTVILTVWFPGILFSIDGGWTGLRIVVGVDVVLGPLLTLIVFKSGKPGLKFDLTCIAIAQIACMTAGMWIVYQERPLALVLAYDTFYSLARQEFEDYDKDPAILQDMPGSSPKLIYVELPESDISADIVNMRGFFIGDPLFMQTEKYRAIPQGLPDPSAIFRREASVRATVSDELLMTLDENCLLSKFISSVTSGYVCFDKAEGRLTEYFGDEYLKDEGEAGSD